MRIVKKAIELYQSKFILSRSIIVISASMVGNVFAYLFQLVTGRYLSVEDYASMVALFSLSGIIPWVIAIFTNGVPKIVAEIKDEDYPGRISSLFFSILKIHFIAGLIITVGMIIGKNFMAGYLNIQDTDLLVIFSLAVGAGILNYFFPLFLQGLLRFKALSFITFISSLTKFMVGITVVLLGLRLIHIFGGLAIATILMMLISIILLKKNLINRIGEFNKKDARTLVSYSLASAFGLAGVSFLQNNDVILVKHFFDSYTAGIYSSTAIIGRIVFFAASPVTMVMLPICAEKYKKGEDFKKPFITSLILALLIGGSITLIYWIFPHTVISILFGEKYLPAEPFLPLFAIFMLAYTCLYMITFFLIAISRFKLASLSLLAAFLQYIGIHFFNENLYQVIQVSIVSVLISSIAVLLLLYRGKTAKARG